MILIINLGLKSIRAIVFDKNGQRLVTAARKVNSRLAGDRVEQDAEEWQEKLREVTREAMDGFDRRGTISHVTVSCSASCLVPVDAQMKPVSRVIMVSDKRAVDQGKRIAADPAFQALARRYGYSSSQYSQMARILWIKENAPDTWASVTKYLAPNDFLIALLTGGQTVTDSLNAEKLYWDHEAGSYPADLYDRFGISADLLPRCVPIGENLGAMDARVAADLGIPGRPEVIVGTYDAICSVFGTGVAAPGQVCDVSGTVTSVRMYSDSAYVDPKARVMTQYFPPSKGYLIGGSNNLGGGLIEWAKGCFYKDVANPYEMMQTESAGGEAAAGATHAGLIFLPNLLGARAPSWNSDARGAFFGLERYHDRGNMMRAIFESIGFAIRDFLEIFRESGTRPEMITASGGLAKIMIANEIKATITGLPYHFMDEFESTSLGAAICVLCATGVFASYPEACQQIVVTRQIFLPRRHDQAYYEDMYGLYRDLTAAVDPLFLSRRDIIARHRSGNVEYVENL
ncbi:MAG: FGGY-family carbohydrate kinase [Nitratireductor sp.]|nr:FGGY-family carbohydrate kinase [Nitratireductor sp.]